jgi:hypothetical protein
VFLSGKLTFYSYDGNVDLDTAEKTPDDTAQADIDVTETGLIPVNRTRLAVGGSGAAPAVACSARSLAWENEAHISVLGDGAVICVKAGDGQAGRPVGARRHS